MTDLFHEIRLKGQEETKYYARMVDRDLGEVFKEGRVMRYAPPGWYLIRRGKESRCYLMSPELYAANCTPVYKGPVQTANYAPGEELGKHD